LSFGKNSGSFGFLFWDCVLTKPNPAKLGQVVLYVRLAFQHGTQRFGYTAF